VVTHTPLESSVIQQLRPETEEKVHVLKVAESVLDLVRRSGTASGMVVGSVARDTWIRGDRDLDIFMLFPPDLPREELEERGLALARSIAETMGAEYREKYAEHPYINATIDGLDVDIVPCYAIADAGKIMTAVDRTPFHTRYISEKIYRFSDDVLLLKQFLKTGGIYGSDQMTEGFSGYLCELLVLHYGGFMPLLIAASDWRPGTLIDIERHGRKKFSEPLIVIDPVDPGRNVSASVSLTRMCEFIGLARGYLARPREEYFFPRPAVVFSQSDVQARLLGRGTSLYALTFATPAYIEEIIVPQLRKSLSAITGLLVRNEFIVNRAAYCMHADQSMLLFELLVDSLPPVKRHYGPPVWNRTNAKQFADKYRSRDDETIFSGPFIENGHYVVEIARRYRSALELLESPEVLEVGLGRHIRRTIDESRTVHQGISCWDEEFSVFITSFLDEAAPCIRIMRE
jgi:tRNA nucleotidyltransferase (CCA-adding enzyme)